MAPLRLATGLTRRQCTSSTATVTHQLARQRISTSFVSRPASRSRATSRSYAACRFSQNRSEVPKNRARRSAVSTVTARLASTISLMRLGGTLRLFARRYCDSPRGLRKSSRRTSPGGTGGRFFGLRASVVVDDLDVVRVAFTPSEAEAPSIVETDAVVTLTRAPRFLEAIARRHP